MYTDCRRGPKAGGHAIHPFAVGALAFLKGRHTSASILVDGVEALPDKVPIGVDDPNGDIRECTVGGVQRQADMPSIQLLSVLLPFLGTLVRAFW